VPSYDDILIRQFCLSLGSNGGLLPRENIRASLIAMLTDSLEEKDSTHLSRVDFWACIVVMAQEALLAEVAAHPGSIPYDAVEAARHASQAVVRLLATEERLKMRRPLS
jgi:hypothetical protein